MDPKLFTGVCALLLTICTTQASFPKNKEFHYKYEGTINAYGQAGKWFTSGFTLTGDLQIQTGEGDALVKLSNPQYDFYNGEDHDDYESNLLPLPEDVSDITKTFRVKFEPNGLVDGIYIYGDEKQYVVNFKKAISSLLQLDMEKIGKKDGEENFAFHSMESSLYGKGKVYYTVEEENHDYRYIQILQEPKDTKHLYKHTFSNVEYENTDFDEHMNRDSQKRLYLNEDSMIDWLEQSGGIYNQPFNTHGESQQIYTNQTLKLKEVKDIETKFECSGSEVYYDNLEYYVGNLENIDSTFVDFSNGRRKHLGKEAVTDAFELIQQIKELRKLYKIKAREPDYKQAFLFNTLTEKMLDFDEKMLSELFDKIADLKDQKILDVYIESLIETGTHSVYYHLMKLIKEEKINGENRDSVENVFVHAKFPNKKLVDDMSEILKWDYTRIGGMKSQMILSFGTLLHKAALRHKMYSRKAGDYTIEGDYVKDFPGEEYYEKYVQIIFDLLKSAESMDKKILYLETLYNTKFTSISTHLLPYVKKNLFKDDLLRTLASYVIAPTVLKDKDLTFEIYWPLLSNSKNPMTLRMTAYYILMKSMPSLQRLINIYWLMESMKSQEIYKIHCDYIKQHSESEDPKMKKFALNLKQILNYSTRPLVWGISSYSSIDYFDEEYSLGEHINLLVAHSKYEKDLILSGSYRYTTNGLTVKPCWVFLRLSGFEPSLMKELKLDPLSKKALFTWENVYKALMHTIKNKKASITLIYAKNDQIVYSGHYEELKDYYELYQLYFWEKYEYFMSIINPGFDLSQYTIIPTELGFPAIYFNKIGNLDFLTFDVHKSKTTKEFMLDLEAKLLKNTRRGLSFYNPILDVQQGVAKLNFNDQEINFRINVTLDYEHGTFKAAYDMEKPTHYKKDMFLEREYSTEMVYVIDEFNKGILQKSYPECKNFVKISMGDAYKVKKDGTSLPLFDIGHDFEEKIFDVEDVLPSDLDPNYVPEFETGDNEDIKSYIKSVLRSTFFVETQPENVNYGVLRHIYFNGFYTISKFDLTLKFDKAYEKVDDLLYPAVVYKMKLHFTAGNSEEEITTWVGDAKFSMDEGHKNNNFAINLAKTIGEIEIKVCAKGDAIWSDEDFKGKLMFSTNLINGLSCDGSDPLVTLELIGEKSEEQKKNLYNYESCYDNVHGIIKDGKPMDCLFGDSTLRKFTFKINHVIPVEKQKEYEDKVSDTIEKIFSDSNEITPLDDVKENEIRAVFEVPMRPAANVQLLVYMEKSGQSYQISDKIDIDGLSTISGLTFEYMHEYGLTDICEIDNLDKTIIYENGKEIDIEISSDWELYFSQSEFKIFIKSTEGSHLAIKFKVGNHKLMIEPSGKSYIFTVDGTKLDKNETHFINDWVYVSWIKDSKIVAVYVKKIGSLTVYNGEQVSIEYSQIYGVDMQGHCNDQGSGI